MTPMTRMSVHLAHRARRNWHSAVLKRRGFCGRLVGHSRMDFVCFGDIVVEIKARSATGPAEYAQVLNYLASSGHPCGLLLNFGGPRLDYKRFILTQPRRPPPLP